MMVLCHVRPGFQEGDQVKEPGYFTKILVYGINPPSGKGIGDEARRSWCCSL